MAAASCGSEVGGVVGVAMGGVTGVVGWAAVGSVVEGSGERSCSASATVKVSTRWSERSSQISQ